MKRNLRGIDRRDITKRVIRKHRKTIFKIREIKEHRDGSCSLLLYGLQDKDYTQENVGIVYRFFHNIYKLFGIYNGNELRMAMWNPEMFEIANVEDIQQYIKAMKFSNMNGEYNYN